MKPDEVMKEVERVSGVSIPQLDNIYTVPIYGSQVTPTWSEFTQNTTFHGIKYIFRPQASLPSR